MMRTAHANQLLLQGARALAVAEQTGIRIDLDYCSRTKNHLSRRIDRLEETFLEETDLGREWRYCFRKIKTGSDSQLLEVVQKMGATTGKQTAKGKESVSAEALQESGVDGFRELIRLRKWRKARSNYLVAIEREVVSHSDGLWYLHPFFHLNTVRTYRSSSSNPNFQNIPMRDPEIKKFIRRAFVPRPGRVLLEADFKALEVGIAACYHRDPTMLEYLRTDPGAMHSDTARKLFLLGTKYGVTKELRYVAKNRFVFPEFYGSWFRECAQNIWAVRNDFLVGEKTLSQHLREEGLRSYARFEEHVEEIERVLWDKRFPVYRDWKERWWKEYLRRGWFDTLTGFRCSGELERNKVINYPVQGSAFHCLLKTLIWVVPMLETEKWKEVRLVGQVHDSALFDLPEELVEGWFGVLVQIVRRRLPKAWPWIVVPMGLDAERSEVDGSWYEMKEMEEAA